MTARPRREEMPNVDIYGLSKNKEFCVLFAWNLAYFDFTCMIGIAALIKLTMLISAAGPVMSY